MVLKYINNILIHLNPWGIRSRLDSTSLDILVAQSMMSPTHFPASTSRIILFNLHAPSGCNATACCLQISLKIKCTLIN